jgi:Cu-Zn family superoxide dismutase
MKAQVLFALIPIAVLAACNRSEAPTTSDAAGAQPTTTMPATPEAATAQADLKGASGSNVQGTLRFTAADGGVTITGELTGLPATTVHGFHIHETGDCSAPDAASAGGHFNPTGAPHGDPLSTATHLGDIPNVESNSEGRAVVDASVTNATLRDGGANDLVGKAVIVHAKPDDYKTQPSGDSGDRIACGVVQ